MSTDEKPSFPADYVVPAVWEFQEQEGKFSGMNRPTAGTRFEKTLPKGDHALQLYSLGTPNGIKVTMLLEELAEAKGVEYGTRTVGHVSALRSTRFSFARRRVEDQHL